MSVHIGRQARYNKGTFPTAADIQSVLDGGEKLVTLGDGIFDLDVGITIPTGVRLRGEGPGTTILQYKNTSAIVDFITLNAFAHLERLSVQSDVGSGVVTSAVATGGDDCDIEDVRMEDLVMRLRNFRTRVNRCNVIGDNAILIIEGDQNIVTECFFSDNIRAVHIDGGDNNIVKSNQIAGTAASSRGIHISDPANFNQIIHNQIRDIQLASPGVGIDLESTKDSNQIAHNIFSGTFGVKAMRVNAAGVKGTVMLIGNQTIEVSPPSARFVLADLMNATGLANT